MKVSVITPTYGRSQTFHRNLYQAFKTQTHPDKELLVLDDSPTPSEFFTTLEDPAVLYLYADQKLSIGEKRNLLIQHATGEAIVHFDDDDYYAPTYLAHSLEALENFDFITLDGWYTYAQNEQSFFYWDTCNIGRCHYKVAPRDELEMIYTAGISDEEVAIWTGATRWGFGFSYVYRRAIFDQIRFDAVDCGEDYNLVKLLQEAGYRTTTFPDRQGLILHVIHQFNISIVFPQYILPNFLLDQIFGSQIHAYIGSAVTIS